MNKFKFSFDNKRYHTLNFYNKTNFSARVEKAVINAGFSRPNRDGKVSVGGCTFCDNGSNYFCGDGELSQQLDREIARIHAKRPNSKIVAYFQSGSNTYADISKLQEIYQPFLQDERLFGLSIATRADCIDENIADYLKTIAEKTRLTVELGLQTANDNTAKLINRGHDFSQFVKGYERLKSRGIRVCVHIINGLPNEEKQDMLDTAREISKLRPDGVKIHMLNVVRGTPLEKLDFRLLSRDEYVDITVSQLELLPPETVIERLTGDGDKRTLIAPEWVKNKIAVLSQIDREFVRRNTFQGVYYDSKTAIFGKI